MEIQRCPECGGRLKTNYCDMCLRKVPFKGVPAKQTFRHVEGSSAHREEKHTCIDFDYTEGKPKSIRQIRAPRQKKTPTGVGKKKGAVLAIVLAVMSVITPLFGLVEEAVDSVAAPEPDYNISEGFVEADDLGAEDVPNVIAGEIYNDNGIRITADTAGLSYGEYTVFMTIYNDTNKKISVSFENISVNSFMLPFGAYQEVKAGKSEQLCITFYDDELEKAGITQVSEVAFALYAYEANDYEDIVVGELVTLQTETTNVAEPAVDTSGLELYNDGSVRIVLRDVSLPGYDDCELELYAENLSGSNVNIYNDGVWVNGQLASSYYWKTLRPDTRALDDVYIYELDDLNIAELSQIKETTINLYVEYMDGWDVVESASESITFEPSVIH